MPPKSSQRELFSFASRTPEHTFFGRSLASIKWHKERAQRDESAKEKSEQNFYSCQKLLELPVQKIPVQSANKRGFWRRFCSPEHMCTGSSISLAIFKRLRCLDFLSHFPLC